jgi:hypothetical protein
MNLIEWYRKNKDKMKIIDVWDTKIENKKD